METYLCHTCGRQIPLINQVVHSARCLPAPSPTAVPSAPPQAEAVLLDIPADYEVIEVDSYDSPIFPAASPSTWTCPRCTFLNPNDSDACEVCGTHWTGNSPRGHISVGSVSTTHEHPEHTGNHLPFTWTCSQCTYDNASSCDQCTMCGSVRPPADTYRETLLSPPCGAPLRDAFHARSRPMPVPAHRPSSSSSSDSSGLTANAALLGAGIGAGLAWLNNGSMARGALEGAGVGALGGMLLSAMEEALTPPPPPHAHNPSQQPIMPSHTIYFSSSGGRGREMDPAFQEVARQMAEMLAGVQGVHMMMPAEPRGLDQQQIAQLPTRRFHPSDSDGHGEGQGSEQTSCCICLSAYSEGEEVRTLPCMHHYHSACIDRWLGQSRMCPVCKHTLT